MKVKSVEIIQV